MTVFFLLQKTTTTTLKSFQTFFIISAFPDHKFSFK